MLFTQRIPVSLITGALGAGKTTVVNRLLGARGERRLVVLVNELGALGVDGALVQDGALRTVELTDGCVCCALQGELSAALLRLLDRVPGVERVLLETTGAADPGPLAWTLLGDPALRARLRLDGVITVVDGVFADQQALDCPEWARQVLLADRLLLSKTALASPSALAAAERALRALRPGLQPLDLADLGLALWSAVEGAGAWSLDRVEAELRGASAGLSEGSEDRRGRPTAAHSPDLGVRSVSIDGWLDPILVELWLDRLLGAHGGALRRLKGLLALWGSERLVVLQCVHGQRESAQGGPVELAQPRSIVVLIGVDVDLDEAAAGLWAARWVENDAEQARA